MGTPRVCRPADYLPSGTVGQWPPATGQWWNEWKGGDPRTAQVTQGADSELPGWQPKEKVSQLPHTTKEVFTNQRGLHQCRKKRGGGGHPRTLTSRRHWLLQGVAATTGTIWVDGRMRRPVRLSWTSLTRTYASKWTDGREQCEWWYSLE